MAYPPFLFKIRFNIILPPIPRSSKMSLHFRFKNQNYACNIFSRTLLYIAPTSSSLTETRTKFTAERKPRRFSLYYFLQTPISYSLRKNISTSTNVTHKKQLRTEFSILYHPYLATGMFCKPYSKIQTQLRPKPTLLLSLIGVTSKQ